MNKKISFFVFFFLGFVCFPSLNAQENRILNKSSFIGFYEDEDCIGRIEDNKIQFYNFSRGVWQKDNRKEFTLPNGYTKAFFVGDLIGVVISNSSGVNTIKFYEPDSSFLKVFGYWTGVGSKADFVLPAGCIDVAGHGVIPPGGAQYGSKRYELSVITQERVRGYRLNNTGWESFIIDDEVWMDKLPRGITYVVGSIGIFAYMPVVNNKVQFYSGTGQGAGLIYEFSLPNGWSDVFAADGIIAVFVNREIIFFYVNIYHAESERIYDRDL